MKSVTFGGVSFGVSFESRSPRHFLERGKGLPSEGRGVMWAEAIASSTTLPNFSAFCCRAREVTGETARDKPRALPRREQRASEKGRYQDWKGTTKSVVNPA